jgi:hypothetical protein
MKLKITHNNHVVVTLKRNSDMVKPSTANNPSIVIGTMAFLN